MPSLSLTLRVRNLTATGSTKTSQLPSLHHREDRAGTLQEREKPLEFSSGDSSGSLAFPHDPSSLLAGGRTEVKIQGLALKENSLGGYSSNPLIIIFMTLEILVPQ